MSGERAEMRRPAVKMATAMPAAEMVTTTAATMSTAVMTAAVATAVTAPMPSTMATATSRDGEVRHVQHRCEDNRGNSQCNF